MTAAEKPGEDLDSEREEGALPEPEGDPEGEESEEAGQTAVDGVSASEGEGEGEGGGTDQDSGGEWQDTQD